VTRLVIVESPYAPSFPKPTGRCTGCKGPPHYVDCEACVALSEWQHELDVNRVYLRAALIDCIDRGESPYASHQMLTDVLDDTKPEERAIGIAAGCAWRAKADATVVYTDRGVTPGMLAGIEHAQKIGRPIAFRELRGWEEVRG